MEEKAVDRLYVEVSALGKEARIAKLREMVDDVVYASKGPELNELDHNDLKLVIDGLSSAFGMVISYIQGNHPEPWEYIQQNVFCAYRKVFKGAVQPGWE